MLLNLLNGSSKRAKLSTAPLTKEGVAITANFIINGPDASRRKGKESHREVQIFQRDAVSNPGLYAIHRTGVSAKKRGPRKIISWRYLKRSNKYLLKMGILPGDVYTITTAGGKKIIDELKKFKNHAVYPISEDKTLKMA